jgi:hypothetical protein
LTPEYYSSNIISVKKINSQRELLEMRHIRVALVVCERKIEEINHSIELSLKELKKHRHFMHLHDYQVIEHEDRIYEKCIELKKIESNKEYFESLLWVAFCLSSQIFLKRKNFLIKITVGVGAPEEIPLKENSRELTPEEKFLM